MSTEHNAIKVAGRIKVLLEDFKKTGGFTPKNIDAVNELIDKVDAIANEDEVKNDPSLSIMVATFAKSYKKLRDDFFKAHEDVV